MSGTLGGKYLVTGANGMLGSAVVAYLQGIGRDVTGVDLADADLTVESEVRALVERVVPSQVIHCAAYTNVDGAESAPDICRAVNVDAVGHMARACRSHGCGMLLVSTDYVFDGGEQVPIPPDAPRHAKGVYARTKLEGEDLLSSILPDAGWIVRTAWLFGPHGHNFIEAIVGRLEKDQSLRVVGDQVGSPTYTIDLASRLIDLVEKGVGGVYHLTNSGQCSWHEFACAIAREAGFPADGIACIASDEWPAPAPRPAWSVLDCTASWQVGLVKMPDWRDALRRYLAWRKLGKV